MKMRDLNLKRHVAGLNKKVGDINKDIDKIKGKVPHIGVLQEFKEFLKEYKVVGLAVAFMMGIAATTLVQSLVNNVIMPIITPFIPKGGWQTATFSMGPIVIAWGAFLAALINFIILAFVVFMIAKYFFKEEKVTKK